MMGMWREKVDQHNTGIPLYERIERVIVERAPQSVQNDGTTHNDMTTEAAREIGCGEPSKFTEVTL